jgi:protein SCO1
MTRAGWLWFECRLLRGSRFTSRILALTGLFAASLALSLLARAQLTGPVQDIGVRPELLKDVAVEQKLDSAIPLGLTFKDENGTAVELRQYFRSKPVILSLVYYQCPMLCTQVLNGLERSLKELSLNVGQDFTVVTVSIDPTERPVLALAKQQLYTGLYGRPGAAQGWHFLTGDEPQIEQLASAVGFRYAYDPDSKQFAHASVIMLLTPDGRISRYFYGITYPSRDLRLGLIDASQRKIGSPVVDAVLLFCYHYDPQTGKYGLVISHVIQIAGGVTVLAIAGLIFVLGRREHYALPGKRV